MKYLLVMLIILANIFFASQSNAVITFERWYGGTDYDEAHSVCQSSDGGYAIVGYTESFGATISDVLLIRTDSLGDTLWIKTYGGNSYDYGYSIAKSLDGGYIITGYTASFGAGEDDVYLIKVDSLGNEQWAQTYGGANNDWGHFVSQTLDDGYILVGYTNSFGAGGRDVYLVKTDSYGDTLWTKTYGSSDTEIGWSVSHAFGGGYIVAGTKQQFGGTWDDMYVVRTDSLGNVQWERTYGGTSLDEGFSIIQASDSGYILLGSTVSFGNGSWDVYLIMINSFGDTLWTRTFGGSDWDRGRCVTKAQTEGYIIAGYTMSYGAGGPDVYFIKTDSIGNAEWTKTFGGTGHEHGYCTQQTMDGGYIIAGYTGSFGAGSYDVYLIKTDSEGNVGIEEQTDPRPKTTDLRLLCYPNPFTTGISIYCSGIRENQKATIEIYDISGRLLKSVPLTTNHLSLGTDLLPGVYFLKADGKYVGKVVKVR